MNRCHQPTAASIIPMPDEERRSGSERADHAEDREQDKEKGAAE
jgi:hypothetical protein